jgi:hypothetical protein
MKPNLQIVHSIALLQCTACGSETNATCKCGAPYVPAAVRVAEYDKANPGRSTRQAAADLGVSKEKETVRTARGGNHLPPETVTGRDGKTYKARSAPPDPTPEEEAAEVAAYEAAIEEVEKVIKTRSKPVENACDYDWDNPKPEDFGDQTEMYRQQAGFYRKEAIHFAKAYPLLPSTFCAGPITSDDVSGVRAVIDAWNDVLDTLTAALTAALDGGGPEEIAAPDQIEDNIMHSLERMNEHARIFKRHIKLSALDREAKERINAAIERTFVKWRSAQSLTCSMGMENERRLYRS